LALVEITHIPTNFNLEETY